MTANVTEDTGTEERGIHLTATAAKEVTVTLTEVEALVEEEVGEV
jgi:hypothetical protein